MAKKSIEAEASNPGTANGTKAEPASQDTNGATQAPIDLSAPKLREAISQGKALISEEAKIQFFLVAANLEAARKLWMSRDWPTYSRVRDKLVGLTKVGRGRELTLQNLKFIYFVNSLLPYFDHYLPDEEMFSSDVPRALTLRSGRSGEETSPGLSD